MRTASKILFCAAIGSFLFAIWGLSTAGGSAAFDEMSGMIPFFFGLASPVLLLAAGVAAWLGWRSKA